ncbi:NADH-quinone oxidoreductase subunit M [Candidatus Spongiihabitans sp.]|uniref:NADH-quinone oxidoreductase subunit M n=1 Tax=Candidatus Spongiihabitans sp. TaxID=3101308 RepID=UPI003C79FD64
MENKLLSALIWLPIVAGVLVLATGNDQRAAIARKLALGFSVIIFLLSISLYSGFDAGTANMQFTEHHSWISAFNIYYSIGVDGISMPLILLTTLLTVVVIIAGWQVITERVAQYMAAFLIMEGVMIGVFSALDAVLFYVFWETMLIPMFLIIGIWGGPNRIYATIKFFLYTLLGSLLMLVALLYLYNASGSFSILDYHALPLTLKAQILIFLALFSAFAVKVPMFPVHTWLPDAHVEAPTGGSVILAAVMLKMGGYGFIRLSLPITPDASHELAWLMITLSLIAVVYIALVALVQQDMKKLIAYSSISHMGFVTLGLFIFNAQGAEGALMQMISHGFISGALFLCVGVLYDRTHSRMIDTYGGIATPMPVFAALFVLFAMANTGLPGTSGFVGEFLVILGAFQANPWFAIIAALTLIFGAAYTLWMVKRVIYGKVVNQDVAALEDVNSREILMLGILAALVLVVGIWPNPVLEVMHTSIENLLRHVDISKCPVLCR